MKKINSKNIGLLFSNAIVLGGASLVGGCFPSVGKTPPNIIFILTDDQGYGDLACHGNPWIKTPHLDRLHSESVRFTNFHAGTTSSPTRSGLMTGKYCNKVGVWHTVNGRSILSNDEVTLAQALKNTGYATAVFGKWHLGDNYPFRPQDRGFDETLVHGGGGVGNQADFWNNDYFDDTYFRNGVPEKFDGYCTDVWFAEALKFISKSKDKPFFCYIALNAPHAPYHVSDKYSLEYRNNPNIPSPDFYGMIANIDENVGKLRAALKSAGVDKNTILVFMTDNGTSGGVTFGKDNQLSSGYNAGMRGQKGSPYDGGHRVPFFIHWPDGGIATGRDINQITSYVDFMPTLLDLCHAHTDLPDFDGISLKPLIHGNGAWPDRVLFTDTQREEHLVKGKQSAVMTDRWRLIRGNELYDINRDPGQTNNVISDFPEIAGQLRAEYEKWWSDVSVHADLYQRIIVGSPVINPVRLNSHDHHVEQGFPAWSQNIVRKGLGTAGFWAIEVVAAGDYEIELRRWPQESNLKMNDKAAPVEEPAFQTVTYPEGSGLALTKASLSVADKVLTAEITPGQESVKFTLRLEKGNYDVTAKLTDAKGIEYPAYYAYVFLKK